VPEDRRDMSAHGASIAATWPPPQAERTPRLGV
jgi:hypothetical protein